MYPQLLISFVFINFVTANDQNQPKYGEESNLNAVENKNNLAITMGFPKWKQHFWKPHKRVPRNMTYIDRGENMIRLPTMYNLDEKKDKKKFLKKSPKRTIQKIIKKNRQKTKKILIIKMTTTISPENFDIVQDELSQWKDEATTMASNQKKRYNKNKYNSRIARYPMPFQRLQKMRAHNKREKRDAYKDSFYILKDFNQVKFLDGDKDVNVVNAHIKKYW